MAEVELEVEVERGGRASSWAAVAAMTYKLVYLAHRAVTVSREEWPRTWKSHAVFASQFAVAGSRIEWMRYCNRIDAPEIDGEPVELPMVSQGHDGVALINNGQNEPSLSPLPEVTTS